MHNDPGRVSLDIRVVTLAGCPNQRLASERLTEALAAVGASGAVPAVVVVDSPGDALSAGLRGSPTFLIDGSDPFPGAAEEGWACRLYPTEDGLEGAPSVAQLVSALTA